ncbi:hypothetical protein E2562_019604 [Oryza meyeriana var. granulata]|uniref:Uncharacterized protein n=1 Tax=Oryza meyeriana var. granulata TaxID=110450 RepID=A0A6G1EXI9_9ORYZ|nr:hypothetical protein E2562_019604 [Oryza meyeriana var. granulata]
MVKLPPFLFTPPVTDVVIWRLRRATVAVLCAAPSPRSPSAPSLLLLSQHRCACSAPQSRTPLCPVIAVAVAVAGEHISTASIFSDRALHCSPPSIVAVLLPSSPDLPCLAAGWQRTMAGTGLPPVIDM